eukprot:gene61335-83894_t
MVGDAIDRLIDRQQLSVLAARLRSVDAGPDGIRVTLRPRNGSAPISAEVDRIIVTTGPGRDQRHRHPRAAASAVRCLRAALRGYPGGCRPDGCVEGIDDQDASRLRSGFGSESRRQAGARILVVGNEKGGAGKSTVAALIATALLYRNVRVADHLGLVGDEHQLVPLGRRET